MAEAVLDRWPASDKMKSKRLAQAVWRFHGRRVGRLKLVFSETVYVNPYGEPSYSRAEAVALRKAMIVTAVRVSKHDTLNESVRRALWRRVHLLDELVDTPAVERLAGLGR